MSKAFLLRPDEDEDDFAYEDEHVELRVGKACSTTKTTISTMRRRALPKHPGKEGA